MNHYNIAALALIIPLAACKPESTRPPDNRQEQAARAADALAGIRFNSNAEIDNIKRRLEITSNPNQLGYIILLNEAGQPIMYEGVVGKVTSGDKRLAANA